MDERLAYAIKFRNLSKTIDAYISESFNLFKQECLTTVEGIIISASPETVNQLDLLMRYNRPTFIYGDNGQIVEVKNPKEIMHHLLDVWGRASNRHNARVEKFKASRSIENISDLKMIDE